MKINSATRPSASPETAAPAPAPAATKIDPSRPQHNSCPLTRLPSPVSSRLLVCIRFFPPRPFRFRGGLPEPPIIYFLLVLFVPVITYLGYLDDIAGAGVGCIWQPVATANLSWGRLQGLPCPIGDRSFHRSVLQIHSLHSRTRRKPIQLKFKQGFGRRSDQQSQPSRMERRMTVTAAITPPVLQLVGAGNAPAPWPCSGGRSCLKGQKGSPRPPSP